VQAGSRSCRVPTYGPVGHVQVGLMISRSPNALGRALGAPYVRTCEHPGADNATCGRIRRSGLDRRSSGLVTRHCASRALLRSSAGPRLRGAGHASLTAWPPQDDVHRQVSHPRSRPSTGIADRSPTSDRVRLSDDLAFRLRSGQAGESFVQIRDEVIARHAGRCVGAERTREYTDIPSVKMSPGAPDLPPGSNRAVAKPSGLGSWDALRGTLYVEAMYGDQRGFPAA
jgi:hypothetical protein